MNTNKVWQYSLAKEDAAIYQWTSFPGVHLFRVSKLPVRQFTCISARVGHMLISKLPVRQFTTHISQCA